MAKMEFIRTYQCNEVLRSMRPIVADIDGTETEKRFFHRFRLAVADGLGSHIWNFTTFWNRVVPQMSHQDEAVKHAVIALGAAYQLFQLPDKDQDPKAKTPDGFTRESLEVFTIQQYNRSICELQRHVGSSSPESIQVTLVCCLAFICLETLRKNYDAAVTHLINGLKILESLPIEHFDFPADTVTDPDLGMQCPKMNFVDMRDIIQLFGRLETSACFFASGIRPIVAERGYAHRKFDDGSYTHMAESGFEFRNLREAHRAYAYFLRDVLARLYETTQIGETGLWSAHDPAVEARQQECLRLRAARLDVLMKRFTTGPYAPGPDSPEHFCLQLDLLHFRCAQSIIASIDENISYNYHHTPSASPSPSPLPSPSLSTYSSGTPPPFSPPQYHSSLLSPPSDRHNRPTSPTSTTTSSLQSEILSIATNLNQGIPPAGVRLPKDRIFNDGGIIGPVYLVAVTSPDSALRTRALRLLADMGGGYGESPSRFFWDGPGLRQRLGLVVGEGVVMTGVPFVQDALERIGGLRGI